MKMLSHESRGWIDVPGVGQAVPVDQNAIQVRNNLERLLSGALMSEQLVILTGLGTSLCVTAADGSRLAPQMSDLWSGARRSVPNFEQTLAQVKQPIANLEWLPDIELFLSRCQIDVQLNDTAVTKQVIIDTEKLIVDWCRFHNRIPVGVGLPYHEAFLRKIARRAPHLSRTKLFTTNYDLCFEQAAASVGYTFIDGFSHTLPQSFDGSQFSFDLVRREEGKDVPAYVPNVLHLMKLHGSVDWWRSPAGTICRYVDPPNPVIIYPKSAKFESSYDQPYLEMMTRFQSGLRQNNVTLVIVGFGFNDAHLVGPIESALRSNTSLRLIAIGPFYETETNIHVAKLRNLIALGDRRVTLLDATFEDVIPLIPDIVKNGDDELHNRNMRSVFP